MISKYLDDIVAVAKGERPLPALVLVCVIIGVIAALQAAITLGVPDAIIGYVRKQSISDTGAQNPPAEARPRSDLLGGSHASQNASHKESR